MVPKSIMDDVTVLQQKLLARIQEEPSIRKTDVLAVEVRAVAGSPFKEATVFTKRLSSAEKGLAVMRRLQAKVAGKLITFYNAKMYDFADIDDTDRPREYTAEEIAGQTTTTPSPSKAVDQTDTNMSSTTESDDDKPSETVDTVTAVLGAGLLATILILAAVVAHHWRKSTPQATPFALNMANSTTAAQTANQVDYSIGTVPQNRHNRVQDGDLYDEVAATVTGLPATVAETSFTGAGQAGQLITRCTIAPL